MLISVASLKRACIRFNPFAGKRVANRVLRAKPSSGFGKIRKAFKAFDMHQREFDMEQSLRKQISSALVAAENEDTCSVRAQTLRLIKCAMTDRDVTARGRGDCSGCDDEDILSILETMVAQREISVQQYDDAGRIADAERERDEIDVLNEFLPQPLQGEALAKAVTAVVADLEAKKLKDVGRCMTALRARYPGQIECGAASKAVRAAIG